MKKLYIYPSFFVFIFSLVVYSVLSTSLHSSFTVDATGSGDTSGSGNSSLSGTSGSSQTPSSTISQENKEEEACFQILTEATKNQFGVDLKSVLKDETSSKKLNLSTYATFRDVRTKNTKNNNKPFFDARRNNIRTIIAPSEYIRSQFASFGQNTNFTFPLKTQKDIAELGDVYPDFRDSIVYTHHLQQSGDFVSCGYLRVSPKGDKTLQDLSQENYMTNTLNDSGFELIDDNKVIDGQRFLIGKVAVSALNYSQDPLFRIDLITVAYDNQTSLFNEYETFPYQVKAMTNPDIYSQGIDAVQEEFLKSIHDNTCLQILHESKNNLPSICGGEYKSLSAGKPISQTPQSQSIFASILDWLIPSVSARLDESERDTTAPIPQGIMKNEAVSLSLQNKINAIPDENMQEFIRIALSSSFEEYVENRKKQGVVLTPFEKTFSECGISYKQRLDIITEWVNTIDPSTYDSSKIRYPDPKIGDCILLFPDERNRSKVITGSFESNQLLATILTQGTGVITKPSPEQQKMMERVLLDQEYMQKIQALKMNGSGNIDEQIAKLQAERDAKLKEFDTSSIPESKSYTLYIGIALLISGIVLVAFLTRKKKPTSTQNP